MKGYTVKCPMCGTLNKSLFLEETEGAYECELCGYIGRIGGFRRISEHSIRIRKRIDDKKEHKKRRKLLLV
ncbi:MAG: hypothetical protein IKF90_07815 [Parasporobacterium sp.]|nr:hypothetical protein [Parasporobacterium sp.]